MELQKFTQHFAEQFENTDLSEFSGKTIFRDIEEWDSFIALSVIAMVDEEYHVKICGEDIRSSTTIEDIFSKVQSKLN